MLKKEKKIERKDNLLSYLKFFGIYDKKNHKTVVWAEKPFIPKDTINTLNKEIIKPKKNNLISETR
jgi:hypothetical protein